MCETSWAGNLHALRLKTLFEDLGKNDKSALKISWLQQRRMQE